MARELLIRFVVHAKHWQSGKRSGLFQAIDEVFATDHPLRGAIEELTAWFADNLEGPFREAEERRPRDRKVDPKVGAISWIKGDAKEHVSKLHQLKALMEQEGCVVEELRTMRPGVVLYEDQFQIVAQPFADTPS